MTTNRNRGADSTETILTFDNRNLSQWSVVWSTSNIPGMDTATGGDPNQINGRRRLRIGTFVLAGLLTMHCRVTASALNGGFFIFLAALIMAVALLANPLRHFEIYLGQWSISGPGRAFRMIPIFDGIGLAICINAIVRAISCCTIAAITSIYIWHSVSDLRLPFTYCRDFDLNTYEPIIKDVKIVRRRMLKAQERDDHFTNIGQSTVGLDNHAWRNVTLTGYKMRKDNNTSRQIQVCKETYSGGYPPLFDTPAYNFFYVEVMRFRPDFNFKHFNIPLLISINVVWLIIWLVMIAERIIHGRLIWNNTMMWFAVIPWIWTVVTAIVAASNITAFKKILHNAFRLAPVEVVGAISDALIVALYIHSASIGTELIHGKGLNHYASGHLDEQLNEDNVWHSCIVLLLAALNSSCAALCARLDYTQVALQEEHMLHESTLWILPMYSKCTLHSDHSHLMSCLIFGGLTFAYMTVAYILLKTALHTIFEYRVQLVFIEQVVVGLLVLGCMGLSSVFATQGGVPLLESVDTVMTGIAMPLVCLFELIGMLYVYRGRDFISDMNISTEENTCSTRISTQWKIIPFITLLAFALKLAVLLRSELPSKTLYIALAPLLAVFLSVPIRACVNAYNFFKTSK